MATGTELGTNLCFVNSQICPPKFGMIFKKENFVRNNTLNLDISEQHFTCHCRPKSKF